MTPDADREYADDLLATETGWTGLSDLKKDVLLKTSTGLIDRWFYASGTDSDLKDACCYIAYSLTGAQFGARDIRLENIHAKIRGASNRLKTWNDLGIILLENLFDRRPGLRRT